MKEQTKNTPKDYLKAIIGLIILLLSIPLFILDRVLISPLFWLHYSSYPKWIINTKEKTSTFIRLCIFFIVLFTIKLI